MSFGEINVALGGMSRASLSRLLKTLVELGHVHKGDSGGLYSAGYRLAVFAQIKTPGRREFLLSRYVSVCEQISERFGVTTLIHESVQDTLVCIHRQLERGAVHMQDVGHVNDQPEQPWMMLVAAYRPCIKACYAADRFPDIDRIAQQGYAYDDQTLKPQFRRLAFPLFDAFGELIGALGVGGSMLEITDDSFDMIVQTVTDAFADRGSVAPSPMTNDQ